MKIEDYVALGDYICPLFGECNDCPLGKYEVCETDPTSKEVLDAAKQLSKEYPNNKVEEILSRYERATII